MNPTVKEKFASYPDHVLPAMEHLRSLIVDVAVHTEGVGELEETLKWGEPAYLTTQTKSGSTIRIDWKSKSPDIYAMYFNCNTHLVSDFRSLFPNAFTFEGNRAIVFGIHDELPEEALRICIRMALRYHLDK